MSSIRRSAKQVVSEFVSVLDKKVLHGGVLTADDRTQLFSYRLIAAAMGWRDICGRIDRMIKQSPPPDTLAPGITLTRLDSPHGPGDDFRKGGSRVAT